MRVNAITMRDHFGGGVSFGGGTRGGVGFLCKRLPELFTHTIVWVYWLPCRCNFSGVSRESFETSERSFATEFLLATLNTTILLP